MTSNVRSYWLLVYVVLSAATFYAVDAEFERLKCSADDYSDSAHPSGIYSVPCVSGGAGPCHVITKSYKGTLYYVDYTTYFTSPDTVTDPSCTLQAAFPPSVYVYIYNVVYDSVLEKGYLAVPGKVHGCDRSFGNCPQNDAHDVDIMYQLSSAYRIIGPAGEADFPAFLFYSTVPSKLYLTENVIQANPSRTIEIEGCIISRVQKLDDTHALVSCSEGEVVSFILVTIPEFTKTTILTVSGLSSEAIMESQSSIFAKLASNNMLYIMGTHEFERDVSPKYCTFFAIDLNKLPTSTLRIDMERVVSGVSSQVHSFAEGAIRYSILYPTGKGNTCQSIDIDEAGGQLVSLVTIVAPGEGGMSYSTLRFIFQINLKTLIKKPDHVSIFDTQVAFMASYISLVKDDDPDKVRYALIYLSSSIGVQKMDSICPNACNFSKLRGKCVSGACVCEEEFDGDDCGLKRCMDGCDNGGVCNDGFCVCPEDYKGIKCETKRCPKDCNLQGTCSEAPDYACTCSLMWSGVDCSIHARDACDSFTTSSECLLRAGYCGWCRTSGSCLAGDIVGPYGGKCPSWHSDGNWNVGILIVAIIIIVMFVVMVLNNMSSAIALDYATAAVLANSENLLTSEFLKQSYWRDERSAKSWKLFDQLQFAAAYMFFSVAFPSNMVQFLSYLSWSNLSLPPIFPSDPEPREIPGRTTADVLQHSNSNGMATYDVFANTVVWFLLLLLLSVVVYGIYSALMWVGLHKKESNIYTVLYSKFFYLLSRIILLSQFPLVLTACYEMSLGRDIGRIVAAIIVLIVFGFLPIIFNGILVWNKGKGLLFLHLKVRFGAFYSIYHYEKARFNLIYLGQKLLTAMFIGFLATTSEEAGSLIFVQAFAVIAVKIIYLAALVVIRPYLDQVHFILDILLSVLQSVAVGIIVMHQSSPSTAATIVAAVCIMLQVVCSFMAYVISWVNLFSIAPLNMWVIFGPKYSGISCEVDGEMTEVDRRRAERRKREDIANAMPVVKNVVDDIDESVDSSLEGSDDNSSI